jgi:hypothetical protein
LVSTRQSCPFEKDKWIVTVEIIFVSNKMPHYVARYSLDFDVYIDDSLAFFNVGTVIGVQCSATDQPSNMPADFVVGMSDMIPLMGGHAWNPSHEPDSVETWDTPVWLMGPYDGGIVDFEPMIPLKFIIGDTDHEYSESLVYEGQTIDELPSSYSVNYDATTSITTLVLVGSSADKKCKAPKAAKKKKCKKSKNKKDKSSKNKKD